MKTVRIEGIEFHVSEGSFGGVLYYMINTTGVRKDVFIPDTLPDKTKIMALGSNFCVNGGQFGEVSVSDSICVINTRAFAQADIDSIIWPSGCQIVPDYCFSLSAVKYISGLDAVQFVSDTAFAESNFEVLSWPKAAEIIPLCCFSRSHIKKIEGLDLVTTVKDSSFSCCEINDISWPSNCKVIPSRCFYGSKIGTLKNLKGVSAIEENAFLEMSSDSALDFSEAFIYRVEKDAFRSANCKVIPPYYSGELFSE